MRTEESAMTFADLLRIVIAVWARFSGCGCGRAVTPFTVASSQHRPRRVIYSSAELSGGLSGDRCLCYRAVMPSNHDSDRGWVLPYAYAMAAGIGLAVFLSLVGMWLHR